MTAETRYVSTNPWISIKAELPPHGITIWWASSPDRFPRLTKSDDFCHEDDGYWMLPEIPVPPPAAEGDAYGP